MTTERLSEDGKAAMSQVPGFVERRLNHCPSADAPFDSMYLRRQLRTGVLEPSSSVEDLTPKATVTEADGPGYKYLVVENSEGATKVPVWSVRNPAHHILIAQMVASGEPIAFEAVGVFGVMLATGSARGTRLANNGLKLWGIKEGRDATARAPMLVPPYRHIDVIDYSKHHPDYHYLKDPGARKRFQGQLVWHTVGAFNGNANVPRTLITTSVDTLKRPKDQHVQHDTVCVYSQPGDKDWEDLGELIHRIGPDTEYAVTSDNPSDPNSPFKQPPFNLAEYIRRTELMGEIKVKAIVIDEAAEQAHVRSSHTQIRLPFPDEGPELIVIRRGCVSEALIEQQTGHKVRILESVVDQRASRGYRKEDILDGYVLEYLKVKDRMIAERERAQAKRFRFAFKQGL